MNDDENIDGWHNWIKVASSAFDGQLLRFGKWIASSTARNPLGYFCMVLIILLSMLLLAASPDKNLWDLMELLIVPIVLAIAGFWISNVQKSTEIETSNDRRNQDTLERYFDRMSTLLLEKSLGPKSDAVTRNLARTLTLAVLRELDARRNGLVLQFLRESELIGETEVVDLKGADLTGASLAGANLNRIVLSHANLSQADLKNADLASSTLNSVTLTGADLRGADLRQAEIAGFAVLEDADLRHADLRGAVLPWSKLQGAKFDEMTLLWAANLEGAEYDELELMKARLNHIKTIMPDGSRYPDWIRQPAQLNRSWPKTLGMANGMDNEEE